MRILFWSDTLWPGIGGVEVLAVNFLQGMLARGFEFTLITRNNIINTPMPELDDYMGMPLYRLPFDRAIESRDPRALVQVRRRLAEIKQSTQFDLTHIFHSGPGLFFHLQTPLNPEPPLVVSLHQAYSQEALAPDTLRGLLFRQARWLVACSQSVLADTRAKMPEITGRSSAIANSLPLPAVAAEPLPAGPPRLLCIGRVVAQKGFDVALRAFARLAPRYPLARLAVAGDGDDKAPLEWLAGALGIADKVDFLGWVTPPEIPALLNRSTLVVMPSRYEPFGLVALQAGQMARPIVASRVDGLPEVVVDGVTGLLVNPEDAEGLAQGIAALLDDPARMAQMGLAGQQRARQTLLWERHLDDYEALFERIVRSRNREAAH